MDSGAIDTRHRDSPGCGGMYMVVADTGPKTEKGSVFLTGFAPHYGSADLQVLSDGGPFRSAWHGPLERHLRAIGQKSDRDRCPPQRRPMGSWVWFSLHRCRTLQALQRLADSAYRDGPHQCGPG